MTGLKEQYEQSRIGLSTQFRGGKAAASQDLNVILRSRNVDLGMADEAAGVNDFGPLRVRSIARYLQQLLMKASASAGLPVASAARPAL
jgi:hypothetical protein